MFRKLLATALGGLALASVTAAAAAAAGPGPATGATGAFLCYSKYQMNPGVWSLVSPSASMPMAQTLMNDGYWAPYAEKTVPTATQLGNGYYLDCRLPSGLTVMGSKTMGLGGTIFRVPSLSGQAGFYPLAG